MRNNRYHFQNKRLSVTAAAKTVGNTCQPSLIGNIFIPASLRIQIAVSRIEVDVFIECKIHTGFPDGCILRTERAFCIQIKNFINRLAGDDTELGDVILPFSAPKAPIGKSDIVM